MSEIVRDAKILRFFSEEQDSRLTNINTNVVGNRVRVRPEPTTSSKETINMTIQCTLGEPQ